MFGEEYKSRRPSTVTRIRKIDKCFFKLHSFGNIKRLNISCIKAVFNFRFGDDN